MDERNPDTAPDPAARAAALAELRRRLMGEVFTRSRRIEELDDAIELGFAKGQVGDQTLQRLRDAWPQFDFQVRSASHDAEDLSWLRIAGPPGTKELFRRAAQARPNTYRRRPIASALSWRWRVLTNRLRVHPDFIIIGTSKSGTTSLYYYLLQHPLVIPTSKKELFFFDRDYARGMSRYRAHFPTRLNRMRHRAAGRKVITGEASPTYLEHPRTPERIHAVAPAVRLIAILRDPVQRAYSLYQLKVRSGEEQLSFEEAIAREEREVERERKRVLSDDRYFSRLLHHHAYLTGGIYVEHLRRWTEVFPREQLLILSSRKLQSDRTHTYGRVLEFLDLPAHTPQHFGALNTFPYPPMDASIRERLADFYRPHNERLWEFLGEDYGWGSPP